MVFFYVDVQPNTQGGNVNVPPHTDSSEHNNTTNETHTGSSVPSAPPFDSAIYM